jgi:putative nucleotidyltransferase with HDIG domain
MTVMVTTGQALAGVTAMIDENDRGQQVLVALALALEARDPSTCQHSRQVAALALRLTRWLELGPEFERQVLWAGLLHDIGKVAVPDAVLRKPGPLTSDERAIMQVHPVVGHQICLPMISLRDALGGIRHHHEWWNGRGYPDGLSGDAIPLMARLLAIADAYAAMTADRPHRRPFAPAAACAELRRGAGSQWDPALTGACLRLLEGEAHAVQHAAPGIAI